MFASPAIYFAYRDHGRAFEAVGLWDWDGSPVTVTGAGRPESVTSLEVTREILPILGATPIVGRTFGEADDRPGSAPTAVISYGYWQRRFGGADPVGDTLVVDDLAAIPARFGDVDTGVFHLGGTRLPGGFLVTMDGKQGADLLEPISPRTVIPVHYDDYGRFRSPLSEFTVEVERRGLGDRVRYVQRGETVPLG